VSGRVSRKVAAIFMDGAMIERVYEAFRISQRSYS
jgi:hypothetical protein